MSDIAERALHTRAARSVEALRRSFTDNLFYVTGRSQEKASPVDLYTALYAPVRLNVGDSIYFDSGMAHAYIAVGEGVCRVLSICTGAEAQLVAAAERQTTKAEPVIVPAPQRRMKTG